ncbi:hypothetical protein A1507_07100 [Methylomonas koyamae]|uniref:Uncharacterized protein n=1 Tax=Methylomonas koyamae TaxID=702114 RepID=A0A177NN67_9GAMM|nr:hypothetical protein A1507_07100 [Methylomonas koyamae]
MNFSLTEPLGLIFTTLGCISLAILAYRVLSFYLVIFFGKNIRITYIDATGFRKTKKFRLDKDEDLLNLLNEIERNKDLKRHFLGREH